MSAIWTAIWVAMPLIGLVLIFVVLHFIKRLGRDIADHDSTKGDDQ